MVNGKREIAKRDAANSAAGPQPPVPAFRGWAADREVRRLIAALVACLVAASTAAAQGNTAVVTGAEHVFIRRGPGTEFPPFANLSQGATVEIKEMLGEWALVQTVTGQSGYVRSTFLSLTGERPPTVIAPRAAVSTATPADRQVPTVSAPLAQTRTPPAERHPPQQEPPGSPAQPDTAPSTPPTVSVAAGELEKLHSDVARLTATVEQLQQRLNVDAPKESVSAVPRPAADDGSRVMTSTAVLLAVIGLCVGWLLGNAYGRRQERGRRPRVRL